MQLRFDFCRIYFKNIEQKRRRKKREKKKKTGEKGRNGGGYRTEERLAFNEFDNSDFVGLHFRFTERYFGNCFPDRNLAFA